MFDDSPARVGAVAGAFLRKVSLIKGRVSKFGRRRVQDR
jgi:hypothetical protein